MAKRGRKMNIKRWIRLAKKGLRGTTITAGQQRVFEAVLEAQGNINVAAAALDVSVIHIYVTLGKVEPKEKVIRSPRVEEGA